MPVEKTITLPSGAQLPRIGLGTWTLWHKSGDESAVEAAVTTAIEAGYRHIDCAQSYQNEGAVGRAIKAKIDDGTIKREDIFVTSKLWPTHLRPGRVIPQIKSGLEKIGLDYFDMFLIHWPQAYAEADDELFPKDAEGNLEFAPECDYVDTWKAFEEAMDLGLTKAIGLSNFNHKQIERILAVARIKPSYLQVEINPYFANTKLVDYCRKNIPGIVIVSYAPFGNPSRFWSTPEDPPNILENEKIVQIAKAKGKSPAQVILRHLLQRDLVVVPKSVTPSRIKENIEVFDFELSDDEMSTVAGLNVDFRHYTESFAKDHPHWPFGEEF